VSSPPQEVTEPGRGFPAGLGPLPPDPDRHQRRFARAYCLLAWAYAIAALVWIATGHELAGWVQAALAGAVIGTSIGLWYWIAAHEVLSGISQLQGEANDSLRTSNAVLQMTVDWLVSHLGPPGRM
jgi:hypothetical protein